MDNLHDDILSHTAESLSKQRKRMRRHKRVKILIVFVVLGAVCALIFLHRNDWNTMLNRDPEVESVFRSEWESAAKQMTLTGDWSEDVTAVAESQLGYSEKSHDDWSAAFVSFCLCYAKVEGIPLETDCNRWVQKLQKNKYELYHEADGYIPAPGDLIFFDLNNVGSTEDTDHSSDGKTADHAGLVVEVTPATSEIPARIKTIEGDSDDSVQYAVYDSTDKRIIGYGALPEEIE